MTWNVVPAEIDDDGARGELRAYFRELDTRYHGKPATEESVAAAMAVEPSDDLMPPTGLFLLARYDGEPGGCVGLRITEPGVAELTRLFVRPERRGSGGGAVLLAAAEDAARELGVRLLRLDTRSDLVEARALYARHGYREVPAFSEGPYADHWFEKRLD